MHAVNLSLESHHGMNTLAMAMCSLSCVGYVHIPVSSISGRQLTERWYPASSATVGKAGRDSKTELPLIRIKARYQTVSILPMDAYSKLSQVSKLPDCQQLSLPTL